MSRLRLIAIGVVMVAVAAVGMRYATHAPSVEKVTASDGPSLIEQACPRGIDADGNCLPEPTPEPPFYCVKEGHLECPADSIVVERIEDVPQGAVFIPAHCGKTDPAEVRRCWAND